VAKSFVLIVKAMKSLVFSLVYLGETLFPIANDKLFSMLATILPLFGLSRGKNILVIKGSTVFVSFLLPTEKRMRN
jgi:hypothetical protein